MQTVGSHYVEEKGKEHFPYDTFSEQCILLFVKPLHTCESFKYMKGTQFEG